MNKLRLWNTEWAARHSGGSRRPGGAARGAPTIPAEAEPAPAKAGESRGVGSGTYPIIRRRAPRHSCGRRPLHNLRVFPKRRAPTVILNGAERSEESKASVRKAATYLVNDFGFFAALRMTRQGAWSQVTQRSPRAGIQRHGEWTPACAGVVFVYLSGAGFDKPCGPPIK